MSNFRQEVVFVTVVITKNRMAKTLKIIDGQGGSVFLTRSITTEGYLSVLEAATAGIDEKRVAVRAMIAETLKQNRGLTEAFKDMLRRVLSDDADWLEEELERVPNS